MNNLLTILEQPLSSTIVKECFDQLGIEERKKRYHYPNGNSRSYSGWHNERTDISIEFENAFRKELETTVIGITQEPVDGVLSVPFPFGLQLGDTADVIAKKLASQPKSKEKSATLSEDPADYQYAYWYKKGDIQILAALNGHKQLLWTRLLGRTAHDLKAIAFKNALKAQKKNIKKTVDWSPILAVSPTLNWQESIADNNKNKTEAPEEYIDDFWLTDAVVADTKNLINQYLEKLTIACGKQSGIQICNAAKWFTKALNKLNKQNDYFIETLERDQLAVFIDTAIAQTGLVIPKDVDITAEWRQW